MSATVSAKDFGHRWVTLISRLADFPLKSTRAEIVEVETFAPLLWMKLKNLSPLKKKNMLVRRQLGSSSARNTCRTGTHIGLAAHEHQTRSCWVERTAAYCPGPLAGAELVAKHAHWITGASKNGHQSDWARHGGRRRERSQEG